MSDLLLSAETGRTEGTRPSRRLRREGKIPAVVYGLDADPIAVSVAWPELRRCLTTDAGVNAFTAGGLLGEPPADRVRGCLHVTGQQHDLEDLEIESVRAGQLGGEIHRAPREVGTVAENDQMRVLVATLGREFTGHLNLLERAANRVFGLRVRT